MSAPAWVWTLPFAYVVHIADEFFLGDGFYSWVGEFAEFSARSFLGINFSPRAMGAGVIAGFALFASQDLWRVSFNRLLGPGA
jgi:hypothetical protein